MRGGISYAAEAFSYLRRTGLITMPLRIALALTLMRTTRPFTTARTFWMFALNLRAVTPGVLVPTPPRDFALPRWVTGLPKLAIVAVKWQTRGRRLQLPVP